MRSYKMDNLNKKDKGKKFIFIVKIAIKFVNVFSRILILYRPGLIKSKK